MCVYVYIYIYIYVAHVITCYNVISICSTFSGRSGRLEICPASQSARARLRAWKPTLSAVSLAHGGSEAVMRGLPESSNLEPGRWRR